MSTTYDEVRDGIAIEVTTREDEIRRYVTVKDKLTGKEFSDQYPRSFDTDWIVDAIMTDAIAEGEM